MAVIHVDVVSPGRGLVTGPGFSGTITREDRRYRVELVESDTVTMDDPSGYLGHATDYRRAAALFARAHGLTDFTTDVDFER